MTRKQKDLRSVGKDGQNQFHPDKGMRWLSVEGWPEPSGGAQINTRVADTVVPDHTTEKMRCLGFR
jgi:hypothetical protein